MTVDDLIRQHGDRLRAMDHATYTELVRSVCGENNPAAESAIRNAKLDPQRRFTNICRLRVLQHLAGQPVGVIDRPPPAPQRPRRQLAATVQREPGDESESAVDTHGLTLF